MRKVKSSMRKSAMKSDKPDLISAHEPDYIKGKPFSYVKLVFWYKGRTYNKTIKDYSEEFERNRIERDGGRVISAEVIKEFE